MEQPRSPYEIPSQRVVTGDVSAIREVPGLGRVAKIVLTGQQDAAGLVVSALYPLGPDDRVGPGDRVRAMGWETRVSVPGPRGQEDALVLSSQPPGGVEKLVQAHVRAETLRRGQAREDENRIWINLVAADRRGEQPLPVARTDMAKVRPVDPMPEFLGARIEVLGERRRPSYVGAVVAALGASAALVHGAQGAQAATVAIPPPAHAAAHAMTGARNRDGLATALMRDGKILGVSYNSFEKPGPTAHIVALSGERSVLVDYGMDATRTAAEVTRRADRGLVVLDLRSQNPDRAAETDWSVDGNTNVRGLGAAEHQTVKAYRLSPAQAHDVALLVERGPRHSDLATTRTIVQADREIMAEPSLGAAEAALASSRAATGRDADASVTLAAAERFAPIFTKATGKPVSAAQVVEALAAAEASSNGTENAGVPARVRGAMAREAAVESLLGPGADQRMAAGLAERLRECQDESRKSAGPPGPLAQSQTAARTAHRDGRTADGRTA